MPTKSISPVLIQNFKRQFQQNCSNYAYELMLLQIKIEEDTREQKKPMIEQISRLVQLYMVAVETLQSASDSRFKYFNNKIQSLMMKKSVLEQLHIATGQYLDKKTLQQASKAQMQIKKQQHQMQMYFHQQQIDIKKIQQILKRSDVQLNNYEGRIRNHLTNQQKNLQQRIKSRKKRSQAGSVAKYKIGSTNADGYNIKQVRSKQVDVRMQYFVDCNDSSTFVEKKRKSCQKQKLPRSPQTKLSRRLQYT